MNKNMNTFDLARKSNAAETVLLVFEEPNGKEVSNIQPFDHVLVLDFVSTCWEKYDLSRKPPEIIEFAVVLYDLRKKCILEEYHQYVKPSEVPLLNEFSLNFTGINQMQVDKGVNINTCLNLFCTWLNKLSVKYGITYEVSSWNTNKVVPFLTWSEWDLSTCLPYECKRKYINVPPIFGKWIDLKILYRAHYKRSPEFLNGALEELGLHLAGNEHSGLHVVRNTALLVGRMIEDGLILRLTSFR